MEGGGLSDIFFGGEPLFFMKNDFKLLDNFISNVLEYF